MALNATAKLHSAIFRALDRLGGKTRWVKGWALAIEALSDPRLPKYEDRVALAHMRHLAMTGATRWGWRIISKRGPGGGYRLERAE